MISGPSASVGDERRVSTQPRKHSLNSSGSERLRVEGVHDIAQSVVAGQAVVIGQEATQERQSPLTPQAGRHKVVGARQRGAQHEQQDLGQRVEHLAALTRVAQDRKVIEQ